jgi:hypothetical protein
MGQVVVHQQLLLLGAVLRSCHHFIALQAVMQPALQLLQQALQVCGNCQLRWHLLTGLQAVMQLASQALPKAHQQQGAPVCGSCRHWTSSAAVTQAALQQQQQQQQQHLGTAVGSCQPHAALLMVM